MWSITFDLKYSLFPVIISTSESPRKMNHIPQILISVKKKNPTSSFHTFFVVVALIIYTFMLKSTQLQVIHTMKYF